MKQTNLEKLLKQREENKKKIAIELLKPSKLKDLRKERLRLNNAIAQARHEDRLKEI